MIPGSPEACQDVNKKRVFSKPRYRITQGLSGPVIANQVYMGLRLRHKAKGGKTIDKHVYGAEK